MIYETFSSSGPEKGDRTQKKSIRNRILIEWFLHQDNAPGNLAESMQQD